MILIGWVSPVSLTGLGVGISREGVEETVSDSISKMIAYSALFQDYPIFGFRMGDGAGDGKDDYKNYSQRHASSSHSVSSHIRI